VEFAPSWDGGSPVFTFTASCVSSDGGAPASASGMSTPIVVTALTNGAHYTCTVTATNALGTSPPSATSNDVLAGAPGAPGGLSPIPTSSSVSISWTAPPPNASPITHYDVACGSSDGGASGSSSVPASPVTITGLTKGDSYVCSVTAFNGIGAGPTSTCDHSCSCPRKYGC